MSATPASKRRSRRRQVPHGSGSAPGTSSSSPRRTDARRALLVAALFVAVFPLLTVHAYRGKSATWDEPVHLVAGMHALEAGDYRVDPSHPPILRLWAALPLLVVDHQPPDAAAISMVPPSAWLTLNTAFARDALYAHEDADRLLSAGRMMTVILGVLLGLLIFAWANEWLGLWPATMSLTLYTIEPNVLAHATYVTTDLGVSCFLFGTLYFLYRACRRPSTSNVSALIAFACLAVTSKFSAVLFAPPCLVLLLAAAASNRFQVTLGTAVAIAVLLAMSCWLAIWAAYGFRFEPSSDPGWVFRLQDTRYADAAPMLAGVVEWLDRFRLLPNAFSQGLLQTQGSLRDMMFYLAGEQRPGGWWYYFPLAFLIKTPLGILAALVAGVVVGIRQRLAVGRAPAAFIAVAATGYLLAAMVAGPNLGVRHILPVYPLVLLVAAIAAHHSAATAWFRPRAIAGVCVAVAALELVSVYPHNLTFFNRLVGGPREGFRYLADSNLSWGQNLKPLKEWMTKQRVSTVNLAYFGQAEPGYYDIDCHYLPGSSALTTTHFSRAVLPGFVAISPTLLSGLYQAPEWQLLYAPFRERQPSFVVGNSIRVFWVEEWPLADPGAGDRRDRLTLADALLTLRWYDTAAAYYRQSLAEGDDPDIRIKLALALTGIGDAAAALEQMRLAVAAAPGNGRARLMLASALVGAGDLRAARTEAEAAARLRSGDAATHALLGRIRAMQGQYADAARALEAALRLEPSRADAQQMLRAVQAALRSGQG